MHIRPNQLDPNLQLDTLLSAQKAAAKAEAARTRKKLSEFASEVAGEAGEAYVVEVQSEQGSSERQPKNKENEANHNRRGRPLDSDKSGGHAVSDWV